MPSAPPQRNWTQSKECRRVPLPHIHLLYERHMVQVARMLLQTCFHCGRRIAMNQHEGSAVLWRCEMWIDILSSTALSASPDWNWLVTQILDSANHCQCQQILTQCFLPKPCCPHRTTLLVLITCWIFNVSWQFFSARQFGILIHSILLFDTGLCTCLCPFAFVVGSVASLSRISDRCP